MTDKQNNAIAALRGADAIFRQADAHRTELIELCRALDVPKRFITEALSLPTNKEDDN